MKMLVVLIALALAGPAMADGLTRFETELKPKLDGLGYRSAAALGPSGFVLTDVTMTTPADKPGGKPGTITAKKVMVEDLDFDRAAQKDGPYFLKLRVEGIEAGAEAGQLLSQYGIPSVASDLVLDYRLDPERKVFTLNRLELTMPGLARLELSLVLDGVTAELASAPD